MNPSLPALPSIERCLRDFAAGRLRPSDVTAAALAALDAHDGTLNAVPTRMPRAEVLDAALRADRALADGTATGPLAGLPWVSKDMFETAGLRTTFGSPIFADHVPDRDTPIVARLRAAGAVLLGKSNTPEFAAGSQTFNPVLGATRNPFDTTKTVGGSSGGGACALAAGMALVADGSDLAASLRNPAAFCGVTGLRPSTYLDPSLQPDANAFNTLNTVGPMARDVTGCEVIWRAIFERPAARPARDWVRWLDGFAPEGMSTDRPLAGRRFACTIDFDGTIPVEDTVRAQLSRAFGLLREAGAELVEAFPDFSGADESFQALRALYFVEGLGELHARERHRMKDTVVWNIERGLELDARAIARAQRQRSAVFARMAAFMEGIDGFLLPTAQVLPFALDVPYPTAVNDRPLATYIDWLKSCYWITVSGHPALSLPAGRVPPAPGAPALPVGLQLVGAFRGEPALFAAGRAVEAALAPLNR